MGEYLLPLGGLGGEISPLEVFWGSISPFDVLWGNPSFLHADFGVDTSYSGALRRRVAPFRVAWWEQLPLQGDFGGFFWGSLRPLGLSWLYLSLPQAAGGRLQVDALHERLAEEQRLLVGVQLFGLLQPQPPGGGHLDPLGPHRQRVGRVEEEEGEAAEGGKRRFASVTSQPCRASRLSPLPRGALPSSPNPFPPFFCPISPQELIRKGIPHHFRAIVWQLLCSATDMPVKNQYSELLKMSSPCEKLIRRDIARTYPEHEFFKGQDSLGQEVLFNVMKVPSPPSLARLFSLDELFSMLELSFHRCAPALGRGWQPGCSPAFLLPLF